MNNLSIQTEKSSKKNSTSYKKLSFISWEAFVQTITSHDITHAAPGNSARFLSSQGIINRPQAALYEQLATETMGRLPRIWRGSREGLCNRIGWKNPATASRNLTALEEAGLIKRLHSPKGNLRKECLVIEIVHLKDWVIEKGYVQPESPEPEVQSLCSHRDHVQLILQSILSQPDRDTRVIPPESQAERIRHQNDKARMEASRQEKPIKTTIQQAIGKIRESEKNIFLWLSVLLIWIHSNFRRHLTRNILPLLEVHDIVTTLEEFNDFTSRGTIQNPGAWLLRRLENISGYRKVMSDVRPRSSETAKNHCVAKMSHIHNNSLEKEIYYFREHQHHNEPSQGNVDDEEKIISEKEKERLKQQDRVKLILSQMEKERLNQRERQRVEEESARREREKQEKLKNEKKLTPQELKTKFLLLASLCKCETDEI